MSRPLMKPGRKPHCWNKAVGIGQFSAKGTSVPCPDPSFALPEEPKKKPAHSGWLLFWLAAFWGRQWPVKAGRLQLFSNGSGMLRRSLRVSTSTKGPSSSTTAGRGSRGT